MKLLCPGNGTGKGFNVVDLIARQRQIRSGAQVGAGGRDNKGSIDKENSKAKERSRHQVWDAEKRRCVCRFGLLVNGLSVLKRK